MAVPVWQIPTTGTFTLVITPQSNSSGSLSDTTPVQTLTSDMISIDHDETQRVRELSAMTTVRENMVAIKRGFQTTISEIVKESGTYTSKVGHLWYNTTSRIVKLVWTRGAQAITAYALLTGYRESATEEGVIATLTLGPVDNGAANPALA